MGWLRKNDSTDDYRYDADAAAAKALAEAESARRSDLPGYHWENTKLVETATSRIRAEVRVTDKDCAMYPFVGMCYFPIEWTTSDGAKWTKLDAAKRHEEGLSK